MYDRSARYLLYVRSGSLLLAEQRIHNRDEQIPYNTCRLPKRL